MRKHRLRLELLLLFCIGVMLISSCQKESLNENSTQSHDLYNVSKELACSIAENINIPAKDEPLKFKSSNLKSITHKKVKEINSIPNEEKENICHVINYEGGGFVVLSADKRLMPILAFSESSEFPIDEELTPIGVVEWLSNVKDEVEKVRKKGGMPDNALNKEWSNLTSRMVIPPDPNQCEDEYEQVGPLLTTKWQQGCGFNDFMPSMNCSVPCGRAYAGCVPIAMAQIMRFHQYPSSFNWSLMPNTYGSLETSNLIKAIHDVLPISYKCDGTGVDSDYNKANTFKTSFGYTYASQGSYNSETVTSNLRANKPVMLSGGRDAGWWIFHKYADGHMWVCDGFSKSFICMYDDNGNLIGGAGYLYLHMNWGWGGLADGWFGFNNFNPTVNGTSYTFNYKTKMVYNIKP